MKAEGSLADIVPPGFEIYESVRGQVFLRRKQPKVIRDDETTSIEREIERLKSTNLYKIEVRGKTLTIFESTSGLDRLANFSPFLSLPKDLATQKAFQERFASYQAVMRFTLTDSDIRLFGPERFCFRGSVDGWISIGPPEPLKKVASKYVKHLGRHSLFDLY